MSTKEFQTLTILNISERIFGFQKEEEEKIPYSLERIKMALLHRFLRLNDEVNRKNSAKIFFFNFEIFINLA